MNNPDKYGRTYHFPFSEGVSDDDKINHNWKDLLKDKCVLLEKLDGSNTCIKQSGVYARSHTSPTINPWMKNMLPIWERVKDSLGTLEIFGENLYGVHSIEYTNLKDHFYVFAIRDKDRWLSWFEVETYSAMLDLEVAPIIDIGYFTEQELKDLISKNIKGSKLGGECEGFVLRNFYSFHVDDFKNNVLKYVRKNHVKTSEHWSKNWKRANLNYGDNKCI